MGLFVLMRLPFRVLIPPGEPASQFVWVDNKSDNLLPGDGQPGWSSGHGMLELLATEYTVVAAIWKRRL